MESLCSANKQWLWQVIKFRGPFEYFFSVGILLTLKVICMTPTVGTESRERREADMLWSACLPQEGCWTKSSTTRGLDTSTSWAVLWSTSPPAYCWTASGPWSQWTSWTRKHTDLWSRTSSWPVSTQQMWSQRPWLPSCCLPYFSRAVFYVGLEKSEASPR